MWNLVKQWRLVRWVNSEIERHEKINLVVAAQTGITLLAPTVIQGYSDRRFVRASHVEIRRVLDDCVAKHRLDVVQQPNGLHVVAPPSRRTRVRSLLFGTSSYSVEGTWPRLFLHGRDRRWWWPDRSRA